MAQPPHRYLIYFAEPAADAYRDLNANDRVELDHRLAELSLHPWGDTETRFPFDWFENSWVYEAPPWEVIYRLGVGAGFIEILAFGRISYERGS